jgi:hypothetical protein
MSAGTLKVYANQFLEEVDVTSIEPPHEFTAEDVKDGLIYYDDLKPTQYEQIAVMATDIFNGDV